MPWKWEQMIYRNIIPDKEWREDMCMMLRQSPSCLCCQLCVILFTNYYAHWYQANLALIPMAHSLYMNRVFPSEPKSALYKHDCFQMYWYVVAFLWYCWSGLWSKYYFCYFSTKNPTNWWLNIRRLFSHSSVDTSAKFKYQ
jgi:hypothetical protein